MGKLVKVVIKINSILSKFNIRIEKISKNQNLIDILNNLITKLDINLIFDVGANEGQFAKKIIESGYKRNIISFEPLNNCYENLVLSSSKFKDFLHRKS